MLSLSVVKFYNSFFVQIFFVCVLFYYTFILFCLLILLHLSDFVKDLEY